MIIPRLAPLAVLSLLAALPQAARCDSVPLLEGLGTHTRHVTTQSAEAQRYFDQGLRLLYGFNHGLAIRSFEAAARADASCAMAHWGVALACGPHINFPAVPPDRAEQAWNALALARENAAAASPVEQALIEALSSRYANPQPENRTPLDEAYAAAMRKVWAAYPKDSDVGALFAEALMDLRPWDQWTADGQAQPGTDEVIATLDAVLRLDERHPFGNHLYIHALEASPRPERALAAADRLRDLQPGLAHNVHMPSHIDIRVGQWHQAVASNVAAVAADQKYRATLGAPQDFLVVYAAHNRHMLAWAAMMSGQSALALREIQAMVDEMPPALVKEWAPLLEGFAAMPFEVQIRFGRWDDILAAADSYPEYMPFTKATRLAARAVAFSGKGDTARARAEQRLFLDALPRIPAETMLGNNTAEAVLAIMRPMVEGEILVREGKLEAGFAALREAVRTEDQLRYDEPPGWILPVRHALGASLMAHGRFAEAEQVYRDDLARLPENGWSLFGLGTSLIQQGKPAEAAGWMDRFAKTWSEADVTISSSCYCQPGSAGSVPAAAASAQM